jgi:hypothetical protein
MCKFAHHYRAPIISFTGHWNLDPQIPCRVGYNDFNNLVMQTLWWLHNQILRYIHKKIFSFFLSRFLGMCNQSLKKVLLWPKFFFFFFFIEKGVKKRRISRWFWIRWKSFEKMHQKKLLAKMWRKYALFSFLLMFVKLVLLITFFWCMF